MPNDPLGLALLCIARNAIDQYFGMDIRPITHHLALDEPGASFVTLTQDGRLRGCIGSLEGYRPLADDVAANAFAAAFRDTRFTPLTREEWARTRVEVSLLDESVAMDYVDEADAIARLRHGIHRLILTLGKRRATCLPQVWETLPDPRQFVAQLKLKAGLPADFWGKDITLARYEVRKWKEA